MSIVSSFARTMATAAFTMIGEEPVVIGALTLQCVLAEADDSKDFGTGYEAKKSLRAVCRTADLGSTLILKKSATARGGNWRVEGVSKGADFTTITLEEITKG